MLNKDIQDFMDSAAIWTLSTVGQEAPHAIPAKFHTFLEDGRMAIARVFMHDTITNIEANNKVCVTAYKMEAGMPPMGYRIEGTAEYINDGAIAEKMAEMTAPLSKMGLKPQGGAVVITPVKCIDVAPGPNNGQIK